MALSHLPQPRSSVQIFRLGFLAARTRICSSLCPVVESDDPPPLEKEPVAEETRVTPTESLVEECLSLLNSRSLEKNTGLSSNATLIKNAAYGGSNNPKTLIDLFSERNDSQTAIIAKNEVAKSKEALWEVVLDSTKDKNTESESISHSNDLFSSGSSSDSLNEYSEACPSDPDLSDLPEFQDVTPSDIVQEMLDLKYNCVKLPHGAKSEEEVVKTMDIAFNDQPLEHSDKPRKKDTGDRSSIEGFLDFLKDIPFTMPNGGSNADPVKDNNYLDANMQKSDKNDRLNVRDFPGGTYGVEEEEEEEEINDLEFKSIDSAELEEEVEIPVPASKNDQKQPKRKKISKNVKEENKVVVTFLHSGETEYTIRRYFRSCGEILEVELPYVEEHLLKTAYIYFKTREGYENALKKSGLAVKSNFLIVESATSTEKGITTQIPIPSLIDDPDIPIALVKNHSRTIKIERLTNEISLHHIEEALAFCRTNISGYFLGSSSSVAYVEFETEIGKERALAKQSINVLGTDLVMLRIDNPRTTAVRISNIKSLELKKVISICRQFGYVHFACKRSADILDVQFGTADWPNMSNILNRLNGLKLDGNRLQAEAAPIFSPDVLLALWQQPEERKHVIATARALLHKLGENGLNTSALASLENVFLGKF